MEKKWTAIILAGQRPGDDGFAEANGVASKALIRVGGKPMLGRVAQTLLASPSIGNVVILAQDAWSLLEGDAEWLASEARVSVAPSGEGISPSIAAIAGSAIAPYPVLVTTADHALLQPAMVEAFIAGCRGAGVAFAMVERRVVEKVHPGTRRTWVKFSDGQFSGANMFALLNSTAEIALTSWGRIERERKKALKLLLFLGPAILLRALTRTISLQDAASKAGRNAGLDLRAVVLPFPEAAIDVDKPQDLELAERILAAR